MSYGEVLVDKGVTYIMVNLYCGYLIIMLLFHLGISCTAFVLICTVILPPGDNPFAVNKYTIPS